VEGAQAHASGGRLRIGGSHLQAEPHA
jgi:hypothetical protein